MSIDTEIKALYQRVSYLEEYVNLLQIYQSEESKLIHESMIERLQKLEQEVSDHDQRFDTLQTPWWKRFWFLIDGWPWYDLNGARKHRPWHKKDGGK